MPSEQPYEVIITDEAMASILAMSPEAQDEIAEAIRTIRAEPTAGRKLVPHPVDYGDPHRRAPVPEPRTPPGVRAAVGIISPPTLGDLAEDWRRACAADHPLTAKRVFMARWLEYVFIHGNPVYGKRWLEVTAVTDMEEAGRAMQSLLSEVHAQLFPNASASGDLYCHTYQQGGLWVAVDPILSIKITAEDQQEAQRALERELELILAL